MSGSKSVKPHLKIKTLRKLQENLRRERRAGRKIVFTNGCFDILHVGHVRYLAAAKSLGQILVIGVNTDRSVRALKGPDRPVVKQADRAEVLAALASVDYVTLFDAPTPEGLIRKIRPDFLVKGGDWKKKDIVGSGFVESYGGKVLSIPFVDGFSTTRLIQRINSSR